MLNNGGEPSGSNAGLCWSLLPLFLMFLRLTGSAIIIFHNKARDFPQIELSILIFINPSPCKSHAGHTVDPLLSDLALIAAADLV